MDDIVVPITLTSNKPIAQRPRRVNPEYQDRVTKDIQKQLKNGMIEVSHSPYALPILCVTKLNNEIRVCVDYRAINKITVPDCYPLPIMEEILALAKGAIYMTLLDLPSGFKQLHIHPADRYKLAFITHDDYLFDSPTDHSCFRENTT